MLFGPDRRRTEDSQAQAWTALVRRMNPAEVACIEAMAWTGEPLCPTLIAEMLDTPEFDQWSLTRAMQRLRKVGAVEFAEDRIGKRGQVLRLYRLPSQNSNEDRVDRKSTAAQAGSSGADPIPSARMVSPVGPGGSLRAVLDHYFEPVT